MNILIFGPNGSGKGTQGSIIQKEFGITHIESGEIFRTNIKNGTDLGKKAKDYIDRGDLVPDEITIPMILDRLKEPDCADGWLLDGFPRNPEQGRALNEALDRENMALDYVVEIVLDRDEAKKRIMGRRICSENAGHPNNIHIDGIKPEEKNGEMVCRVCGASLSTRSDDQDEGAIDKRHSIYYDRVEGTMASVLYFRDQARQDNGPRMIELDGTPPVDEVKAALLNQLRGA